MAAFTMIIIIKTTVLCIYCSTAAYTDNRDAGERCSFTVMYLLKIRLRRPSQKRSRDLERERERERERNSKRFSDRDAWVRRP